MKALIPILIGLLVVGCGEKQSTNTNEGNNTPENSAKKNEVKEIPSKGDDKSSTAAKPVKELTLREKVVGKYELIGVESSIKNFLATGVVEDWYQGEKTNEKKWKIEGEGIHAIDEDGDHFIWRINAEGSITAIGGIVGGLQVDFPEQSQLTFKKLKPKRLVDKEVEKEARSKPSGQNSTPQKPPAKVLTQERNNSSRTAIDKAIRNFLNKSSGELTKTDYEKVTVLNLGDNELTELPKGLEKLTQLEALGLHANQIRDVSPLKNLKQLTDLVLGENQIKDLNALKELKQLKYLKLHNNLIKDLSALKELQKLKELGLQNNQISDLSPLKRLNQLRVLELSDNYELTNAQIIELQEALPECRISHNAKFSAAESAAAIEEAIRIALSQVGSGELSSLSRNQRPIFKGKLTKRMFERITKLELHNSQLTDVSALKELKKLEVLTLSGDQIGDLSPLKELKHLRYLNLSYLSLTRAQIDELKKALPKCNIIIL